jgi:hypothetical protein
MTEDKVIQKAKKRVKNKKEFFTHLGIYIVTIFFLFLLNWLTSPGFWWFLIAAGGWAIGIVAHYLSVFGIPHPGGKNWEEEELKKEIRKLKAQEASVEDEDMLELNDDISLKDYRKETLYDDEEFV